MNPPLIRRAREEDLERLLLLYAHLHPSDPAVERTAALRESWRAICASDWNRVLVADRGDRTVATCTLVLVPNLTRGARPYGLVENVVTDPAFRRQGLASALLVEAGRQAREAGCYKLMLMTSRRDEATLRLYRAAGFSDEDKTAFVLRLQA